MEKKTFFFRTINQYVQQEGVLFSIQKLKLLEETYLKSLNLETIKVQYVRSEKMLTDCLTKSHE